MSDPVNGTAATWALIKDAERYIGEHHNPTGDPLGSAAWYVRYLIAGCGYTQPVPDFGKARELRALMAAIDAAREEATTLAARAERAETVMEAARREGDWLPGVWADYQGICHRYPDEPIPIEFENMIHTIQARGFALRDAVAKYDAALAASPVAAGPGGRGEEEGNG